MAPLRGRESELDLLGGVNAAAREGAGGVVVIEGAAGMGKTRLLGEACELSVGGVSRSRAAAETNSIR